MKNFALDDSTKATLKDISTLFGVKQDIVKEVWEYTAFMWFLKLSENPEKMTTITVPFLGNIGIKFESEELDETKGKIKTNVDAFISLSEQFKEAYGNIYNVGETGLAEFLQEKIRKTLEKK